MQVKLVQNPTTYDLLMNFSDGCISTSIKIPAVDIDKFCELIKEAKLQKDIHLNNVIIPTEEDKKLIKQ